MESIWKQPLEVIGDQTFVLPEGSEILCVQVQHDHPCIWFKVPNVENQPQLKHPDAARRFRMIGTGEIKNKIEGKYIGTVQLKDGFLVLHLYEVDL